MNKQTESVQGDIRRFLNCSVPVYKCNLECTYCYLTQRGNKNRDLEEFPYSPQQIADALKPDRMGGICMMNLCASGETLLSDNTIQLIRLLLEEGHYVSIITNNTITKSINAIANLSAKDRIFMKCSFQYIQLKRKNLLCVFFTNIQTLRNAGISYTIEIVADDNAIDMYDEIFELMEKNGEPLPQVLECRMDPEYDIPRLADEEVEHIKKWNQYKSTLYQLQQELWGKKIRDFCYAGDLSAEVNLATGNITPCIGTRIVQNIFSEGKIRFCAVGENCKLSHCFIAYVWQGLCGNTPNINCPNYAILRNRKRKDGSEWLNTAIKKEFENKIINRIHKYNKRQKTLCNYLFRLYFDGIGSINESEKENLRKALDSLSVLGSKVMIYGYGSIGRTVYHIYKGSKEIIVIDEEADGINKYNNRIKCKKPSDLNSESYDGFIAIITPFSDGESIKKRVNNYGIIGYTVYDLIELAG